MQELLLSSQVVPSVERIIKKEPGEELNSGHAIRLPNPKNWLRRSRDGVMTLVILLSQIRLGSHIKVETLDSKVLPASNTILSSSRLSSSSYANLVMGILKKSQYCFNSGSAQGTYLCL